MDLMLRRAALLGMATIITVTAIIIAGYFLGI